MRDTVYFTLPKNANPKKKDDEHNLKKKKDRKIPVFQSYPD